MDRLAGGALARGAAPGLHCAFGAAARGDSPTRPTSRPTVVATAVSTAVATAVETAVATGAETAVATAFPMAVATVVEAAVETAVGTTIRMGKIEILGPSHGRQLETLRVSPHSLHFLISCRTVHQAHRDASRRQSETRCSRSHRTALGRGPVGVFGFSLPRASPAEADARGPGPSLHRVDRSASGAVTVIRCTRPRGIP